VSPFDQLHPSLQYHIVNSLGWSTLRPTQLEAIEPIHAGRHCLLLAPTAGGKTEAAAIPVLSRMLNEDWPATSVLYVCPIKALLNNLEARLTHYAGLVGRRVEVWHGDVSQSRKQRALRDAPDILLTTPESIEGMLISTRVSRQDWFGQLRAVIVDELHAFAADDRGWHLRAVLHRLQQYVPHELQRIGLSATVSNPVELLDWLAPTGRKQVVGSASVSTDADVTIDHVGSLDNAATVIHRLHRGEKRLVFCDSRAIAEKLGSSLRGLGVRTFVSHASLSPSERKVAEAAFAEEKDCVIVATSTLELGIDVGDLDRVIQIEAPSTVSSFLQRMGRTGRRAGGRRNCLFLTISDHDFLVVLGLAEKWHQQWVEAAVPSPQPWPLIAQQVLASTLERGSWPRAELTALLVGAFPDVATDDLRALLDHLVAEEFLALDGDLLQIGPATEREYGRGHYRDLLASFSGAPQLVGRHGSAEIGYIDPTVLLTGEKKDGLILLAGRSWKVLDIEWSKRLVWLEPAKSGGSARWTGGTRVLGPEVCEASRKVLIEGAVAGVTLSRRAIAQLEVLQDEIPAGSAEHAIVRLPSGAARWWTFAGTVANRLYGRALAAQGAVKRSDGLGINFGILAADAALPVLDEVVVELSDAEIEQLAEGVKFASCLPQQLLRRVLMARVYGRG